MAGTKNCRHFSIIIGTQMSINNLTVRRTYNKDELIFPVCTVIEYIKATEKNRKSKYIIMSCHKHSIITTQTVSSYVKQTLKIAGINTSLFTVRSTGYSSS